MDAALTHPLDIWGCVYNQNDGFILKMMDLTPECMPTTMDCMLTMTEFVLNKSDFI